MKCKSCGSELIAGTKKCPYCGAVITIVRTRAEEVFDWSGFSPQTKKKKDVSIDWNTGKIFDKTSGQVYDQKEHTWSEPEAVKDLFKFDRKNEEYQQVLDRQVDSITETNAAAEAAAAPAHTHDDIKREFDLPSSMGMLKFDSVIKGADVQLVSESGEEVGSVGDTKKPEQKAAVTVSDEPASRKTAVEPEITERNISTETGFSFNKADLESDKKESPSPAEQEEAKKDTYTPEEEDRVFNGLKKLMAAEEKFKEDMERASYLTPEESAQAAKVEEKCSKLTFVPTVTFRSIEDEYAAYCDEHGIKHERPKAEPARTAEKQEKAGVPAESGAEKAAETKHKKHSIRESIRESLRNIEKNQDKAVEIKINEPSGTKVTVKTQEVSLAAMERALENAQTREVNMDEVVNPAKNLQVSVEVNAAQGNASVEVTRRHDGATVVKTVDKAHQEHLYVDASDDKQNTISDADHVEDNDDDTNGGSSFWERSDSATKMTITDIFGPEARKILNQIDKNYSEEQKKADEDIENSLILDINPEDIAMTEDQTAALYNIATEPEQEADEIEEEALEEEPEIAEEVSSDDIAEAEVESVETVEAVDNDVEDKTVENENTSENTAGDGSSDESIIAEEAVSENKAVVATEQTQKDAEEKEIVIAPEEPAENAEPAAIAEEIPSQVKSEPEKPEENKAETKVEKEKGSVNIWNADRIAKKDEPAQQQDESSTESVPELEKTRPIMKAEKAIMKEAARQKKRAEKAQKKLLKENKANKDVKSYDNKPENKGVSKVLKLFTAILVIILVVEFSIIGIKLFASDSQAAVFIDKVEQYAVDIVKGGNKNATTGNDSQQSQQDNSSTPEATPDDGTQQPDDGSGAAAPAEGNGAA